MKYRIREMQPEEYYLLPDFLYGAIYQRDEQNRLQKSVIEKPELNIYIKDFGKRQHDYCLCAEVDKRIVGAVWIRIINGFGSIDDDTPEFAISVEKEYRGHGIGRNLMEKMLTYLKNMAFSKASLAVQKDNYAYKLYCSMGFQVIDQNEEEYIMVNSLER